MGTTYDARIALANGDLDGFLAAIEPDRQEQFPVHMIEGEPLTLTMAQVGRTIILIDPLTGTHNIMVHGHDASQDEQCWHENVTGLRDKLDAFNERVEAIRSNPMVDPMAMHVPSAALSVPGPASEPVPHTGMYL